MQVSDADIAAMIEDPDQTLARWYAHYLSPDNDPALILTAGQVPGSKIIQDLFDRWFENSRAQLIRVVCEKLRYSALSESQKQVGEVALVATIATLLANHSAALAIDPMATAVLLVTRHKLDGLCRGGTPEQQREPAP